MGAHLNHLNPPATGSFRGPVACSECHVVPSSGDHAVNPPAQKVVFGTLATTRAGHADLDLHHDRLRGHLLPRQTSPSTV